MIWSRYKTREQAERGAKFFNFDDTYEWRIEETEDPHTPWLLTVHIRRDSEAMR